MQCNAIWKACTLEYYMLSYCVTLGKAFENVN